MNMSQTFIIALSIVTSAIIIGYSIVRADRYQIFELDTTKVVLNKKTGNIFIVAPDDHNTEVSDIRFHLVGNKDLDIYR